MIIERTPRMLVRDLYSLTAHADRLESIREEQQSKPAQRHLFATPFEGETTRQIDETRQALANEANR